MSDFKKNKNKKKKLDIELPSNIVDGVYINMSIINYSSTEFVLDFISLMPGIDKARIKSRIILPPQQFKRLLNIIKKNLESYENSYGKIDKENKVLINFNPFKGEA